MAISRSQMKRQLYQLGGLTSIYGINNTNNENGQKAIYPRISDIENSLSQAEQRIGDSSFSDSQLGSGTSLSTQSGALSNIYINPVSGQSDAFKIDHNRYPEKLLGGGAPQATNSVPFLGRPVLNQTSGPMRLGAAKGGIMQLETRQPFIFGGIAKSVKKAVKGVSKGIKDLVSSDVGKMALLAAGTYGLGGGFSAGGFKFGNLPGAGFFGKGSLNPLKALSVGGDIMQSPFGSALSKVGIPTSLSGLMSKETLGKGAALLGGSALISSLFGGDMQAAQQAYQQNPGMVKQYIKQYYRNINPKASDQEIEEFANSQLSEYAAKQDLADGGRVGFEEGGTFLTMEEAAERDPAMFMDTTTYNPIPADADRQGAADIARIMMGISDLPRDEGEIEDDTMSSTEYMYNEYLIPKRKELMENFGLTMKEADDLIREEMLKLRDKKAEGGMPTGIMRLNQAGVKERDYREDGGFVPVGIKEKADDVPAMLSKNEFVMTADAVRGAGDGDVEKGAQRMYRVMKTLENGGRI